MYSNGLIYVWNYKYILIYVYTYIYTYITLCMGLPESPLYAYKQYIYTLYIYPYMLINKPRLESYSDQAYSCPRDGRLLRIMGAQ